MKEEFSEEDQSWWPIIDTNSKERQYMWRNDRFTFTGDKDPLTEINDLKRVLDSILEANPGLELSRIRLSCESEKEEYEDYHRSYINILYYTSETDEEYKERLEEICDNRELEIEELKTLIRRYPEVAKKEIGGL